MPDRISTIKILAGKPTMKARDAAVLLAQCSGRLAEINFLEKDLENAARDALIGGDSDRNLTIKNFNWSGEFSGSSFGTFKRIIAPKLSDLDLLILWEYGDPEGLRIRNGEVVECDVEYVLKPRSST